MVPRDDDRPKRSWKEIDQAKTLGKKPKEGGVALERTDRYAYNKYKSELNRLFDQGGIGALMTPGAPSAAQEGLRLERALLERAGHKDFGRVVAKHVAEHGMPKDIDVLMACFDVSDEGLVLQALQSVHASLSAGTIKRQQALKSRLTTLAISCDAPKILAKVKVMLGDLSRG